VRYGIIFLNESNAKTYIFFMRGRYFFNGLFAHACGGYGGCCGFAGDSARDA
jgi:hypothetical protein